RRGLRLSCPTRPFPLEPGKNSGLPAVGEHSPQGLVVAMIEHLEDLPRAFLIGLAHHRVSPAHHRLDAFFRAGIIRRGGLVLPRLRLRRLARLLAGRRLCRFCRARLGPGGERQKQYRAHYYNYGLPNKPHPSPPWFATSNWH